MKVGAKIVTGTHVINNNSNPHQYLVCNEHLDSFVVGMGTPNIVTENQIILSDPLQDILGLHPGDQVRYVPKK